MHNQTLPSGTNKPSPPSVSLPSRQMLVGGLLLVLFAFVYYGSYYRSGLNLGGEGGTVALIAMRLLEGQRPLVDTFLGYNLMWFYPIVWLFKLFGTSYIALRIFFFSLCTITGILAYITLCRSTRNVWYSFAISLLPIIVPGMLFRNYLPFLVVLNMSMALWLFDFRILSPRIIFPSICSGLALGLTFLTRIDLGIFASIVFLGGILLSILKPGVPTIRKITTSFSQVILIFIVAALIHVPFYLDARTRGFDRPFLQQYPLWFSLIQYNLQQQIKQIAQFRLEAKPSPVQKSAPTAAPTSTPNIAPTPAENPSTPQQPAPSEPHALEPLPSSEQSPPVVTEMDTQVEPGKLLQRAPINDILRYKNFVNQSFIWALYLPIPLAITLILSGLILIIRGWIACRIDHFALGAQLSISTALALTLFPQYFFFRPDPPHLSEFMVPFYVALAIGAYAALCAMVKTRSWLWRLALALFVFGAGFDAVSATTQNLNRESAGSWCARFGRNHELIAENSVLVFLRPDEQAEMQRLHDLIMQYSKPHDYVVCFPYSPTINFMTNRPSYLWNLYIDDVTAPTDFHDRTIESINRYQPAIIVIDNRAINRTDNSRFKCWARKTYQFIQQNYVDVGQAAGNEIFVRPDRVSPSGAAERPANP